MHAIRTPTAPGHCPILHVGLRRSGAIVVGAPSALPEQSAIAGPDSVEVALTVKHIEYLLASYQLRHPIDTLLPQNLAIAGLERLEAGAFISHVGDIAMDDDGW